MELKISLDERIADGFYMGRSLKLFRELLANPETLLTRMPDDGSIPKSLTKKKPKKPKVKKVKKTKNPKKIKPLKNKIKLDNRMKKRAEKKIEG